MITISSSITRDSIHIFNILPINLSPPITSSTSIIHLPKASLHPPTPKIRSHPHCSDPRHPVYSLCDLSNSHGKIALSNMPASTQPAPSSVSFNPARLRSYILRLPLCTRCILVIIVLFWVASISHGFQHWAQLAPEEVFKGQSRWKNFRVCGLMLTRL